MLARRTSSLLPAKVRVWDGCKGLFRLEGGAFLTWGHRDDGPPVPGVTAPTVHELHAPGDGVLFWSEDLHNVSPVTRGTRQVVVIELWRGKPNVVNRME